MTTPRIAEARERMLSRIRLIVPAYIASAITAADAATGRAAAGRSTPAPRAVYVGVDVIDQRWVVDQTPVIVVAETGGQASSEDIHGSQDEEITIAVYAMHTVDRANIEDAAQTARILALCAGDVISERLAEPLNDNSGSCWVCEIVSSAPEAPVADEDDVWMFSYGVELRAVIRYVRGYSPATIAPTLKALPWRESDSLAPVATITATGSGATGVPCAAGSVVTISLTAGQLAATTALTVSWATGELPAASCWAMRQTAPAASATGAVTADAFSAPVGSVPLANGVEVLFVAQATTTQAAVTYRARIEVT